MAETMFGPYRLEALLGKGGMGEVYRAYHTAQDRTVALKLLLASLASDDEYRERFLRESQVTARLTEPHVIPIHNWGEIGGRLYLDMRFVEGEDLAAGLRRNGPMPPERAVAVISQVARALDAAHRSGLVHRDVKPSNILLTNAAEADEDFAYLVDFGIARSMSGDSGAGLTQAGTAVGTLDYMAPERFLGERVDGRADVYALACVLYECLTGKRPYPVEGLPALMTAHLQKPPPQVTGQIPGPATSFDEVIARGMAKDRDQRYESAGALASAARRAVTGPVVIPSRPDPSRRADPPGFTGPTAVTPYQPAGPSARTGGTGYPPPGSGPHPGAGRGPAPIAGPPAVPGGFGPPGPGGPPSSGPQGFYGGPGGPTGPGGPARKSSTVWWLAGGGVLLVAAVVVTLVLLLTSGGGGPVTPSTSPTASGGTTSTTTTTPPSPSGSLTSAQQALLAILPAGFTAANCEPAPSREINGITAAIECSTGPDQGPTSAVFLRFPTAAALEASFRNDASVRSLPQNGALCRDGATVQDTYNVSGTTVGLIGCFPDPNGYSIEWTDPQVNALAIISRTDNNAAVLYDWWTRNGFRS